MGYLEVQRQIGLRLTNPQEPINTIIPSVDDLMFGRTIIDPMGRSLACAFDVTNSEMKDCGLWVYDDPLFGKIFINPMGLACAFDAVDSEICAFDAVDSEMRDCRLWVYDAIFKTSPVEDNFSEISITDHLGLGNMVYVQLENHFTDSDLGKENTVPLLFPLSHLGADLKLLGSEDSDVCRIFSDQSPVKFDLVYEVNADSDIPTPFGARVDYKGQNVNESDPRRIEAGLTSLIFAEAFGDRSNKTPRQFHEEAIPMVSGLSLEDHKISREEFLKKLQK